MTMTLFVKNILLLNEEMKLEEINLDVTPLGYAVFENQSSGGIDDLLLPHLGILSLLGHHSFLSIGRPTTGLLLSLDITEMHPCQHTLSQAPN